MIKKMLISTLIWLVLGGVLLAFLFNSDLLKEEEQNKLTTNARLELSNDEVKAFNDEQNVEDKETKADKPVTKISAEEIEEENSDKSEGDADNPDESHEQKQENVGFKVKEIK